MTDTKTETVAVGEIKAGSLVSVGHDEDSWGVGVSGVVSDPAPYPRINRLRDWFLDECAPSVDSQRALLITEAYKKYADEPQMTKSAKSLAHILDHLDQNIVEGQLLVGDIGAPPRSCAIFPEMSYQWVVNEMKGEGAPEIRDRPSNQYGYDDKVRDDLLGIADFWKGKTLEDAMISRMSWDSKKGDFMGIMLYSTSLYHYAGVGHLICDFTRLLDKGYSGLRAWVQEKLDGLEDGDERAEFYNAQLIVIDASIRYIHRFADRAREQAKEADGERRDELLQMAENFDLIAENPPETFWQAFQLVYLCWSINQIDSNGHSVSFGRLDQILYPYFTRDIENGTCTRDFAQEIIDCMAILNSTAMKLRDWLTTQANSGRFMGTCTVTLGGVDADGNDATNELSGMFIDMVAHTRIVNPWTAVRIHDGTPDWFFKKIAKAMRMGTGEPKLFSDEMNIPGLVETGFDLKDARNWGVVGCVEPAVPGKENGWQDSAYFSIARVLELATNDGYAIGHEDLGRLGPATGRLEDMKSYEDVKQAYDRQMSYWATMQAVGTNIMDEVHREMKPLPYLSLFVDNCTDEGRDIATGAARYNFTGPQAAGVGTAADSLTVLRKLVFEDKRVSPADMMAAIKSNWEGHEQLYHLINSSKVPQYGNDDDYADEQAIFATDVYCKYIEGLPNPRGGVYQPGVYTVSANVPLGMIQAASFDGRKDFEPLSDCLGPVHTQAASHDRKGPTAVIRSAGKLDQHRMTNGTLLNMRFMPTCLSGEAGIDNFISLVKAYFKKGRHLQINVLGREVLQQAYDHPEKFRGLVVRVAGYSALWADLSDELRKDLLDRTEMSFD